MTKTLLLFILILGSGLVSLGQAPKISIYAKVNYSFPSIEDYEDQISSIAASPSVGFTSSTFNIGSIERVSSPKIGYDFGASVSFDLRQKFSISTGLGVHTIRYNEKSTVASLDDSLLEGLVGGSFERDADGNIIIDNNGNPLFTTDIPSLSTNQGFDYSLTYIKLPITSSYKLMKKLSVHIGVDISYLLKSKREYDQFAFNQDLGGGVFTPGTITPGTIDVEDYFNNVEIVRTDDTSGDGLNDLVVGVVGGFEYLIFKKLSITADYNRSLSNIYKNTGAFFANDYKAKNNAVSLGITYHLK